VSGAGLRSQDCLRRGVTPGDCIPGLGWWRVHDLQADVSPVSVLECCAPCMFFRRPPLLLLSLRPGASARNDLTAPSLFSCKDDLGTFFLAEAIRFV